MTEWWTYTLTDLLLFSPKTYHRLFELYNREIWPAQAAALVAGVAILALLSGRGRQHGRAVAALLGLGWAWVAWAFHFERYATINWAATYFAGAFGVEALLVAWWGVVRGQMRFERPATARERIGRLLFGFAVLAQPLIGPLAGRSWIEAQLFGLAPDPTTVGTLGLLLAMSAGPRWQLLAIPLLWCAVGGAFLWAMGTPDALVMPVAGLVTWFLAAAGERSVRAVNARRVN